MGERSNRLTELSPLIVERINEVTRNKKEQEFLIMLLKDELSYGAYVDPTGDHWKKNYKFLLDTYFPYSDSGENDAESS